LLALLFRAVVGLLLGHLLGRFSIPLRSTAPPSCWAWDLKHRADEPEVEADEEYVYDRDPP
jgi:hypothetical protein